MSLAILLVYNLITDSKEKDWCRTPNFQQVKGTAEYLVCGERGAVIKDYKTKHAHKYKHLTGTERDAAAEALIAKLQKQQRLFAQLHSEMEE